MESIEILTREGQETDLTVSVVSIHGGGFTIAVITDKTDDTTITVYDDEIDNLIAALIAVKDKL